MNTITLNSNLALQPMPHINNVIEVNFHPDTVPQPRRTTSIYKSNGVKKATAADPIRDPAHIKLIQEYFLSHGQLRNYTIFTVGILFGLRAGDLLSLRVHHVLNTDGSFKSHCDLIESKTRKFNNPVITPTVQKLLTNYLKTFKNLKPDDPLFRSRKRNDNGEYFLDISSLDRILSKTTRELNLPHISSHSLRKTFCYQLLQQNPSDDAVKFAIQQMLNHDSFKTTLAYCGITQDIIDGYRTKLEETII